MTNTKLINDLYELADWADANQWETPITLGNSLREAANYIHNKEENNFIIWEYPVIEPDIMAATGYCSKCGNIITEGKGRYCPFCGVHFSGVKSADCLNCIHYSINTSKCDNLDSQGNCLGWKYNIYS